MCEKRAKGGLFLRSSHERFISASQEEGEDAVQFK